jgi:hypothetical protein
MPSILVLLVTLLLLAACDHQEGVSAAATPVRNGSSSVTEPSNEAPARTVSPEQPRFPEASTQAAATLTYRTIDAPGGTFGYEILSDGNLFIRQVNIPGKQGTAGCKTRSQAEALAELVIRKVKAGAMPPTVTAEELTALNLE